ncbi:MAG: hypothetical protein KKB34_09160 [Bacteroidetes bacterium]|nr:hypothetical protein [Bacteroidota bacterium]
MKIFGIIILLSSLCLAQNTEQMFSGNLFADKQISLNLLTANNDSIALQETAISKKSPFLAGLFSFIVPGAGEFYSGSYLKAALFVAAEAAAITVGLTYDKKGDDQTKVFENYAHAHWDVAKYARWTLDNIEHLNSKIGSNVIPEDYKNLFLNAERTKVNWEVLHKLENDIGGWYSHRLEYFGEQQYYEMIGKYPQFNPGWDDFDESSLYTYTNSERTPVTANFDYYSGLRGKANDYYNIASKAVVVVIVNHVISAIDAAWTASRYNKNISLNTSLEKTQIGFYTEYYPQINMKINF